FLADRRERRERDAQNRDPSAPFEMPDNTLGGLVHDLENFKGTTDASASERAEVLKLALIQLGIPADRAAALAGRYLVHAVAGEVVSELPNATPQQRRDEFRKRLEAAKVEGKDLEKAERFYGDAVGKGQSIGDFNVFTGETISRLADPSVDFDTLMAAADFETWLGLEGFNITPEMFGEEAGRTLPEGNPLSEDQMTAVRDFYAGGADWADIAARWDAYTLARSDLGSPVDARQARPAGPAQNGQTQTTGQQPAAPAQQAQPVAQSPAARTPTNFVTAMSRVTSVAEARLQAVADTQPNTAEGDAVAQAAETIIENRRTIVESALDALGKAGIPADRVDAVREAVARARSGTVDGRLPSDVLAPLAPYIDNPEVAAAARALDQIFSPASVGAVAYEFDLPAAQVEKLARLAGVPAMPAAAWPAQRALYQAASAVRLPDTRVEAASGGLLIVDVRSGRAVATVRPDGSNPLTVIVRVFDTGDRFFVTRAPDATVTSVRLEAGGGRIVEAPDQDESDARAAPKTSVTLPVQNGNIAGAAFRTIPAQAVEDPQTPVESPLIFVVPEHLGRPGQAPTPAAESPRTPATPPSLLPIPPEVRTPLETLAEASAPRFLPGTPLANAAKDAGRDERRRLQSAADGLVKAGVAAPLVQEFIRAAVDPASYDDTGAITGPLKNVLDRIAAAHPAAATALANVPALLTRNPADVLLAGARAGVSEPDMATLGKALGFPDLMVGVRWPAVRAVALTLNALPAAGPVVVRMTEPGVWKVQILPTDGSTVREIDVRVAAGAANAQVVTAMIPQVGTVTATVDESGNLQSLLIRPLAGVPLETRAADSQPWRRVSQADGAPIDLLKLPAGAQIRVAPSAAAGTAAAPILFIAPAPIAPLGAPAAPARPEAGDTADKGAAPVAPAQAERPESIEAPAGNPPPVNGAAGEASKRKPAAPVIPPEFPAQAQAAFGLVVQLPETPTPQAVKDAHAAVAKIVKAAPDTFAAQDPTEANFAVAGPVVFVRVAEERVPSTERARSTEPVWVRLDPRADGQVRMTR
ncbi:MAG: hypothetical protein JO102_05500, partial [Elusimicrobia bacterium]|nr:hypothetical protein [Elusimicrobiota bacterium]